MAPLSPQSAKAVHYKANLGAALVRGAWADAAPGAAPNGTALSWDELIRKWGKHTGGTTELVHNVRNVSLLDLNSAHHVRASSSALNGTSESSGDGASGSASSYVHVQYASGNAPTAPNGATHSRSASGSHHLHHPAPRPSLPHADGEDGACCHAWVRGANWSRAIEGTQADEVRECSRSLESLLSGSGLGQNERLSAALTLAYCHHALGEHEQALAAYDQFDWTSIPTAGVVEGDAAVVERIRARTCQGICLETTRPSDSARALECYVDAVALLDRLSKSPLTTPAYLLPARAVKATVPSLDLQREPLRHISTALTRATVISARGPDAHFTLRVLRTYHALATNWVGSNFRANQRQRMMSLYLAALQSSYPASGATAPEPHLLVGGTAGRSARTIWRAEVLEAMRTGQRMLSDTTTFPKSGDVNEAVTEFATQIAGFPELDRTVTPDVVAILWWGTTLTFQSQSILRQLTTLLCVSGDRIEARRTFELYVQLVLKARQTLDPESTLLLKTSPLDNLEAQVTEEVDDAEREHVELEHGMDTDEEFASTLLIGAELLLRSFNDSQEAWRYASLAGEVVKHGRVSQKLAAKVEESRGIVRLSMSTNVAGPTQRPVWQEQAVKHLTSSTYLDATSCNAFYHLSYAHATSRAIDPAVDAVRSALELDPQSVRSWHLLALLFTAQGDWNAAARAGEAGVGLWEADDEAIATDEADNAAESCATEGPHPLLLPSGEIVPPPPPPPQRPSRFSRLETVIQLRMTLNVIAEKLHGPEIALERHHQLFSFFSQRTELRGARSTAASDYGSGHSNAPADLGDSYVLTPPGDVHVSPPSPIVQAVGHLSPSSTGNSSAVASDTEGGERRVTIAPGPSSSSKKGLFPKHLHVPSVARQHMRASSASQSSRTAGGNDSRSASSPANIQRSRTASQSTLALSVAPTAIHSHYRGARGSIPSPAPPPKKTERRPAAEERILSDLWLMSAASFRRAGKHGQSLVAIEEAENHDPENPNVWVQLGLLQLAEFGAASGGPDAIKAFTKALLLKSDHPPAVVCMARLNMAQGDVDLAHSLLWQLTEDRGWDVPEAWVALAQAVEKQGRAPRAKECLLEALRLERRRACRPLGDALKD